MRDRVSAPPRTLVARAVRHCSRPAVARARARPPSRAAPATPRACRARLTARARRRDHRDHGDCARVRTVGKKKQEKRAKAPHAVAYAMAWHASHHRYIRLLRLRVLTVGRGRSRERTRVSHPLHALPTASRQGSHRRPGRPAGGNPMAGACSARGPEQSRASLRS